MGARDLRFFQMGNADIARRGEPTHGHDGHGATAHLLHCCGVLDGAWFVLEGDEGHSHLSSGRPQGVVLAAGSKETTATVTGSPVPASFSCVATCRRACRTRFAFREAVTRCSRRETDV